MLAVFRTALLALLACLTGLSSVAPAQIPHSDFELSVLVRTTQSTQTGQLIDIEPFVSINDKGTIAFSGTELGPQGNVSRAFVRDHLGLRGVTYDNPSFTVRGAAINNEAAPWVASYDAYSPSVEDRIRLWLFDGSTTQTVYAKWDSFTTSGQPWVDVNDNRVITFTANNPNTVETYLYASDQPDSGAPTPLVTYAGIKAVRPQISNTNEIVTRDDANNIAVYAWPSGSKTTIADSSIYLSPGSRPAISRDGSVVAFIATQTAEQVFVSIKKSVGSVIVPLIGAGTLGFTDFDQAKRLAVATRGTVAGREIISVAFAAVRNGTVGVYVADLAASEASGSFVSTPLNVRVLAFVGQVVQAGTLIITALDLFDSFNAHGELALWASFNDGSKGVIRARGDLDGDGAYDAWEEVGIDFDDDGQPDYDLAALGASATRRDVFVEYDAMFLREPTPGAINRVIQAFADAPADLVGNPDGSTGVHLVCDVTTAEEAITPGQFPTPGWIEFDAIKSARFGTQVERMSMNAGKILSAKRQVFRYCLFADVLVGGLPGVTGSAELGGNDFFITLGAQAAPGGTEDEQAGTFMHELGHTLGLGHGGRDGTTATPDHTNFKPNYHSVMNYLWQVPTNGNEPSWELDYSRDAFCDPHGNCALEENMLVDSEGLRGTPGHASHFTLVGPIISSGQPCPGEINLLLESGSIDWDSDSQTTASCRDINWVFSDEIGVTGESLVSREDWSVLVFGFRDSLDYLDGVHLTATEPEINAVQLAELNSMCAPPTTYCAAKLNSLGCTPAIGSIGSLSYSGPDDFHVVASNVVSHRFGVLAWSRAPAMTPYGGGTLCLSQPMLRAPLQNSGGTASYDCSGAYDFHVSQAYLAGQNVVAGSAIFVQIWSRDQSAADPEGIGLTNALAVVVCP